MEIIMTRLQAVFYLILTVFLTVIVMKLSAGGDINMDKADKLLDKVVLGELPYINGDTTLNTVNALYDSYKPLSESILRSYLVGVCG